MQPAPHTKTSLSLREPPTSLLGRLKFLGPGFILSASIVGSGELIATTTLGAEAGFTAFWIILVSCFVKVAVQLEFGRHTIITGETAMEIFNKLPGKRIGKAKWSVWVLFLLFLLKFVQLGGMIGSGAIVLNLLFPKIPVVVCVFACAIVVSLLIYRGLYSVIERVSLSLVGLFTVLTVLSVVALNNTSYGISWADIGSGLTFRLTSEMVPVAVGAFGLTGVASDEIIAYNYWCIEKGYAAYTGPRDDSPSWRRRASGWIRVMYLDAFIAMVVYTSVTAAFYLLGAAILHSRGITPSGNEVIETIALIYTESLGKGVRHTYLVGAFFVLFSSLFATLAAWTRIFPDIFARLEWIDFEKARRTLISILAWTVPVAWGLVFLFIDLPVAMILFGGAVGSVMLLLIVFAVLHIHYWRDQPFRTSWLYNLALWISVSSILAIGIYGVVRLF